MTVVSNTLLYSERVGKDITKKVSFRAKQSNLSNRYSQAYSIGTTPVAEIYTLTIYDLTDEEVGLLEDLFKLQDTEQVLEWLPPTELAAKLFNPPNTWKKVRNKVFRYGSYTYRTSVTFSLSLFY